MNRLIVAIQFLTRLPTPRLENYQHEWFAESARYFPMVGMLIGLILAAVAGSVYFIDPWLSAWATILVWVWITGGLHLDGLADLADAVGAAHKDRAKMLAVMKDPHLGSFGVLTLFLHLTGKLILLMLLIRHQQWGQLIIAPAFARLGILYWQTLPPLGAGLGEQLSRAPSPRMRSFSLVLLLIFSAAFAPALCLMPVAIWLYRYWLQKNLQGMNGDCLGAGVEMMEAFALLLALLPLAGVQHFFH